MHSAMPSTDLRPSLFHCSVCTLAIAALGVSFLGCRSGRPSGSMVQVTEDPAAIVADLPALQQRLATTTTTGKRTTDDRSISNEEEMDLVSAVAGMPDIFREKPVASQSPTDPKTQLSLSDSDVPSGSDAKSPKTVTTKAIPASGKIVGEMNHPNQNQKTKPTPAAVANAEVEVTAGGLVSASLTDLSVTPEPEPKAAAVIAANAPEIATAPQIEEPKSAATEPAVDLVAAKTGRRPPVRRSPISQTDRPKGLTQALEQSLSGLPNLPNVKPKSGGPVPTRIGIGESKLARDRSEPETKPEPSTPESSTPEPSTKTTHLSDFITQHASTSFAEPPAAVEDEPSIVMNANQVRPVSHDSGKDAVDVARHELPSSIETIPTKLPKNELSDAELYGQLLKRFTQPAPDESPTERERRLIVARHLMVLAGDPTRAVTTMDGLNEIEQLYMKNQLMGLWTMINPDGHPSSGRRVTEALPKYREATRYMAAATDSLELRSLEFCTEIESYGQIKPFPGNRFSAGQQVILYCEVENFAAADHNTYFQTQLQGSYDIYDASGRKVISQLLPVDQQRSRNRLRDYFVAYQMNLPKALPTGTYRLQLTIEDVVGKKYGQQDIPFEIR